jgi:hypothetical protein
MDWDEKNHCDGRRKSQRSRTLTSEGKLIGFQKQNGKIQSPTTEAKQKSIQDLSESMRLLVSAGVQRKDIKHEMSSHFNDSTAVQKHKEGMQHSSRKDGRRRDDIRLSRRPESEIELPRR